MLFRWQSLPYYNFPFLWRHNYKWSSTNGLRISLPNSKPSYIIIKYSVIYIMAVAPFVDTIVLLIEAVVGWFLAGNSPRVKTSTNRRFLLVCFCFAALIWAWSLIRNPDIRKQSQYIVLRHVKWMRDQHIFGCWIVFTCKCQCTNTTKNGDHGCCRGLLFLFR